MPAEKLYFDWFPIIRLVTSGSCSTWFHPCNENWSRTKTKMIHWISLYKLIQSLADVFFCLCWGSNWNPNIFTQSGPEPWFLGLWGLHCLIPYLDYRSDWLYQHPFGWVYANVLTCPRPLHPYFFGKTKERNCDSLVCKRWDGANVLEIIHYCSIMFYQWLINHGCYHLENQINHRNWLYYTSMAARESCFCDFEGQCNV